MLSRENIRPFFVGRYGKLLWTPTKVWRIRAHSVMIRVRARSRIYPQMAQMKTLDRGRYRDMSRIREANKGYWGYSETSLRSEGLRGGVSLGPAEPGTRDCPLGAQATEGGRQRQGRTAWRQRERKRSDPKSVPVPHLLPTRSKLASGAGGASTEADLGHRIEQRLDLGKVWVCCQRAGDG